MQMNKPEKWKFNKARQNWLVRNIWSPEAISDTYFPLVVKYLSPVQGGPRERLTQTCESYLKVEANAGKDEKTGSSPAAAATTIHVPRSILKPTPGPLIDISSSSEPIHDADAVIPQPPVPKTSIADIRRARAQSLLEALRSNDSNI
ncbi:hypothetical protein CPB84DRAFT_1777190 [Gymnopilus junonius]|uniref:WKF domain-containing protein n=1 Tax=Gymnopilus junonius TaxID=109634 RepID=A0A9P5NQ04_GYMJU|nr:hypothetical protein CPB84DRAFT_1777190 [Gymnopilus junonius]